MHAESHGIYGSQKIAQTLAGAGRAGVGLPQHGGRRDAGNGPEKPRLEGLHADHDPGRSDRQPAPNTLDRDFTATAPNRKWVTDITYLPTAAGWVYLAVVLDLFSRKVVGWAIERLAGHRAGQRGAAAGDRDHADRTASNCCTTAIAAASTPATPTSRP